MTTPIGDAGVATFALPIESGASVTMSWLTDVHSHWNGTEKRHSILRWPRLELRSRAILSDGRHREILSLLAGSASTAPIFLCGLAHEDVVVTSSAGTTITVTSLVYTDWAQQGQRIVVVSPSGDQADAVIASISGSSIVTTVDVSATAIAGSRVMPALQVLLDPHQPISRHQTGLGEWEIVAVAQAPFATSVVGKGATVHTYDGLPVWDEGIQAEIAAQPLRTGSAVVDLGGRVTAIGWQTQVDWLRAIEIESSSILHWQWFKKFLEAVRGRWQTFLLPSGRPDLVPVGDASSGTLVVEGGGPGQPDYATDWFPSLAHRRLKLVKTDGTFAHRKVSSCIDNGNGTQDLVLDSALTGALDRVELLEQVRLDSDSVRIEWAGPTFRCELIAKVVQQ